MTPQMRDVPDKKVTARPVKSFFVNMLTRDISLSDSILDLLDNCIDGVVRSVSDSRLRSKEPYKGYWAEITCDGRSFRITDNCGGIPWKLHDYAFRMGRMNDPDSKRPTVGTYGIGMKRALFKLGRHATIQTQHGLYSYEVEITPDWLLQQDDWDLPVRNVEPIGEPDGTMIEVRQLDEDVKALFARESFEDQLRSKIESHYALIIAKGFRVKLNGKPISAVPLVLRFERGKGQRIKPYIYRGSIEGVDVFLAVGFKHPIPAAHDLEADVTRVRYSASDAGWTVICNDRVVLYCDRTELTGWGEAGIPSYHNQFIAISGFVEFKSTNASKLPTTTTKRGIDASSHLYLRVKDKMREGLRLFTGFTNKWKGRALVAEAQQRIRNADTVDFYELKDLASKLSMVTLAKLPGRQFRPTLPIPPKDSNEVRIAFKKPRPQVEVVSEYLFDDRDLSPGLVGERCFELLYKEARS